MADLTKIGTSLLEMDDIAQYLNIAKGFITKNDKATDVYYVGGVAAENIAVSTIDPTIELNKMYEVGDVVYAINSQHNLKLTCQVAGTTGPTAPNLEVAPGTLVTDGTVVWLVELQDRTTVNNAIHFDGHPWEDVMTSAEGGALTGRTGQAIYHYGNEIMELRDELYQLKHELEKQGIVRNTNQHFGYNDIFRNGYYPYVYDILGVPTMDCPDPLTIMMTSDMTKHLDAGDYIVIYYLAEEKTDVRQIKDIAPDEETVTLDESLNGACMHTAANMKIYRSYGVSRDGNFYFARDIEYKIGDENIWTGLDDDTAYKFRKPVTEEESSYGYSFRIPESKLGFLTKFSIHARAIGLPTLTCYIIDERDIKYFRNPVQAEALYKSGDMDMDGELKMHFFAKSAPVTLDPTLGETVVTFDFWSAELERYPLLTQKDTPMHKVRYVAIIVGTYVDANNYAEILFLRDMNTTAPIADLQKNNTVYYYTEQPDSSTTLALTTDDDVNNSDMYYGVTLKECIEDAMDPQPRGLYTAVINQSYLEGVSRARLTLRFRREGGLWNATITDPGIYGGATVNGSFAVASTSDEGGFSASELGVDNKIRKPMELRKSLSDLHQMPDLIVGGNLTKGVGSGSLVVPDDPIYVRPNDMVYRNAFIVSVKGKRWEYNATKQEYEVVNQKKIYLEPLAVIPDGIKYKKDTYSDRVIFEGDFTDEDGKPEFFNQLVLQIYWEQSNFDDKEAIKKLQMGVIHDLIFSTERVVK